MFRNITEVKRANRAIGHHWFNAKLGRAVTPLMGGFYWVEAVPNYDGMATDYMAVGASPDGAVQYLHGAEHFATKAEALAIITDILKARD